MGRTNARPMMNSAYCVGLASMADCAALIRPTG
jgi:hypothetical protein